MTPDFDTEKATMAVARVFYASQTGGDRLDTSIHKQAWVNIAARALQAGILAGTPDRSNR